MDDESVSEVSISPTAIMKTSDDFRNACKSGEASTPLLMLTHGVVSNMPRLRVRSAGVVPGTVPDEERSLELDVPCVDDQLRQGPPRVAAGVVHEPLSDDATRAHTGARRRQP